MLAEYIPYFRDDSYRVTAVKCMGTRSRKGCFRVMGLEKGQMKCRFCGGDLFTPAIPTKWQKFLIYAGLR